MVTRKTIQARSVDRQTVGCFPGWKLEDAKARFSEVVRRAQREGPQRVTYRGRDAVVVISADEVARLLGQPRTGADLIRFLQSTGLGELVVEREEDRGRDVEL